MSTKPRPHSRRAILRRWAERLDHPAPRTHDDDHDDVHRPPRRLFGFTNGRDEG
jgi:hypothetical protein